MKKITLSLFIILFCSQKSFAADRSKYFSIKSIIEQVEISGIEDIRKIKNTGTIAILKSSNMDSSKFPIQYSSIVENFLHKKFSEILKNSSSKVVACVNCQLRKITLSDKSIEITQTIQGNDKLLELASKNNSSHFLIWDMYILDEGKKIGMNLQIVRATDGAVIWQMEKITDTVIIPGDNTIFTISVSGKTPFSPLAPSKDLEKETFNSLNVFGGASFGIRKNILNDDRVSLNTFVSINLSNSVFNNDQLSLLDAFLESNISYRFMVIQGLKLNVLGGGGLGGQTRRGFNIRLRLGAEVEFKRMYIQVSIVSDLFRHGISMNDNTREKLGFIKDKEYSIGRAFSFNVKLGFKI